MLWLQYIFGLFFLNQFKFFQTSLSGSYSWGYFVLFSCVLDVGCSGPVVSNLNPRKRGTGSSFGYIIFSDKMLALNMQASKCSIVA